MKPAPVVTFQVTEAPTIDKPGEATLVMTFAHNRGEPVRVAAKVRSDQSGRVARVESGGVAWEGGLVWAAFRWTGGDGPPDLLLSWFASPPDLRLAWRTPTGASANPVLDPLNYAEVSDVVLLATEPMARWAVRAFFDELANVGPPTGTGLTVDDVVAAILRVHADKKAWPTQEAVAEELAVDVRTISRIRAWHSILEQAKGIVSG